MTQNKCFKSVPDFEKMVEDGRFSFCFLSLDKKRGLKAPETSFYNKPNFNINTDEYCDRNLGITFLSKDKLPDDAPYLICLDLDGIKIDKEEKNGPVNQFSRRFLGEVFKKSLRERGIDALYVESPQNNGLHIYLWSKESKGEQHITSSYLYPDRKTMSLIFNDISLDLSLDDIAGQRMGEGDIEIFSQNTMVVAPGSVFEEDGVITKEYIVSDYGVKTFGEMSVYDEQPIEDLVADILIENLFQYNPVMKSQVQKQNYNIDTEYPIHDLKKENIRMIGDLIIKYWPKIHGSKQIATVFLGNYLKKMGVSFESLQKIVDYVIDNKNDPNFFSKSDEVERTHGFGASILHDYYKDNDEKLKGGKTKLLSIFQEHGVDTVQINKILWVACEPPFHRFYPQGQRGKKYPLITLSFENDTIIYDEMSIAKTDDGMMEIISSSEVIRHCIQKITYINDISVPRELDFHEKPVALKISKNNTYKDFFYSNRADMFSNYSKIDGAYAITPNKKIPEHIFAEYEDMGLIESIDSSSRAGIYLSKDMKSIRRFVETPQGLEETPSVFPDKDKLTDAMLLLKQIRDAFPWTEDKFEATVKLGLILPYSFIFKHFKRWVPGIVLVGEAGALKSVMGDLICNISTPIEVNRHNYVVSGAEFKTDYRIGKHFDNNSFPIVINEATSLFENPETMELVKDAMIEQFIREPGGNDGKEYYARSCPLCTLNNSIPGMEEREFARRFLTVKLTKSDLYSDNEIEENLGFLNKDGIVNSRFSELVIIGEFIFAYMNAHFKLFRQPIEKTLHDLILALESYTELDLSWLDVDISEYIDIDITDSSQNDFDLAVSVIKKPFLRKKERNIGGKTLEKLLEDMLGQEYDYIFRTQTGVVITYGFEKEFRKLYKESSKIIKLKELGVLIENQLDLDYEIEYKQVRVRNTSVSKKNGILIDWDVFLKIMGIAKDQSDNKLNLDAID